MVLSLSFYLLLFLLTLFFILFAPAAYLFRRAGKGEGAAVAIRVLIHRYGTYWSHLVRLFFPLQIDPFSNLPDPPYVVVVNHRSVFDPYFLALLPEKNVVFIVRAWPFRIPFYGPFMSKAGYLNTEKENRESLLRKGKALLAEGVIPVFFPEGTRAVSDVMGRFRAGAFTLACEANVPVVPLCLHGTGDMLPKGAFLLRPAHLRLCVLPPIVAPQGPSGPDAGALRKAAKSAMFQALQDMRESMLKP